MASQSTILVPNALTDIAAVETFYVSVQHPPVADQYVLDMSAVEFVKPYGVIALISTARHLAELSGHPVCVKNLAEDVHAYLDRVDLFKIARPWLRSCTDIGEPWSRNPGTTNLLELTPIGCPQDVEAIASQAHRIFSYWLRSQELNSLLGILSEVCANVYQHSGDPHGHALIQRYEVPLSGQVIVQVAVGDRGYGIRQSLSGRYPHIGREPLDYLQAAMQGLSARSTGRGGLGLRRVEQIVAIHKGYLWLRSETAAIMTSGPHTGQTHARLSSVQGTQVVVELRASLYT